MNIFINDRSDLDEVIALIPVGHPANNTGKCVQVTRREDLERQFNAGHYPRRDVVLINGTHSKRQYVLEVKEGDGFVGDMWILDILSEHQFMTLMGIGQRMRQNAKDFAPAMLLINRS